MIEPQGRSLQYLLAGKYRALHYREFGVAGAPPVVCVHGLTRNARDFDVLAAALAHHHHVIAVDLPGRGRSEWFEDAELYRVPSYITALSYLLSRFDRPVDLIGTSLGGIIGMEIAAIPGHRLRRMVLNDVGPWIPGAALARIRDYLSAPAPRFADHAQVRLYLRRVHASFGPLSDAQWTVLAEHSARPLASGGYALHYDPAIAVPYAADAAAPLDLRARWALIDIPMLTLRGEHSDLLEPATLALMEAKSATLTVPRTGHAPALQDAGTIAAIAAFLGG